MAIMCVPVEELLCQVVMGWILVLECLFKGACGRLQLCPVKPGIKWRYFSRTHLLGH
jgi:hypothetical protein